MSEKESKRKWRIKNKKYCKKYARLYYLNNKDKIYKINKNWQRKNKDKLSQYHKKFYLQNKEYSSNRHKKYWKKNKNRLTKYIKIYRIKNKNILKDKMLKKYYNINLKKYNQLLLLQNNCCAICNKKFNNKNKPYMDHNHITKKPRGILCQKCNSAIGFLNSDIGINVLKKAINYVKKYI
jgi:hypothetical protein